MPELFTKELLGEANTSYQQLFEDVYWYRYRDGSMYNPVQTIHQQLLGVDSEKDEEMKLYELLYIANEAKQIVGSTVRFPEVIIRGESLQVTGEFKFGLYEGAIDLSIGIQRPEYFSKGIFEETDMYGNTMAKLIGDQIPLWKLRFTPFFEFSNFFNDLRSDKKLAYIAASQRFIGQEDYAISVYKSNCKVSPQICAQKKVFEIFEHYIEKLKRVYNEGHLCFPDYVDRSDIYLFSGIPGNYLLSHMEKIFGMNSHEFLTLLGIAALQNSDFQKIRSVSDTTQPSLKRFREMENPKHASFNYDRLVEQYFEWSPRSVSDNFPWLLEHSGDQLGIKGGQSSVTPQFVAYLAKAPIATTH